MRIYRFMTALAVALFLCSVLTMSAANAGDKGKGKGKDKKEEKEKGNKGKGKDKGDKDKDKGEGNKKGWGDKDVPPGIAKQGEEKIAKWKEAKEKAKKNLKERFRKRLKKKGKDLSDEDGEGIDEATDTAAGAGIDVDEVEDILGKAGDKDLTVKELKELAEAVSKKIKGGTDPKDAAKKAKDFVKEKTTAREVMEAIRGWTEEK